MTTPFREGLVMAVRAARTEGERESREEVAHGLRHAKVRVTSLPAEPDLTLDGNRDYPVEDETPLPHLPPAGCSLFQARPHLFDPREQARDAANDVLDTCTDLAGAKSFEDVTRAAHELRRAAQLLRASAAVLERICARARGEK